jgi:hypothetical protein
MTHSDVIDAPCDGHLIDVDTFADRRITYHGILDLVVTIYQCDRCARRITVERKAGFEPLAVSLAFVVTGL